jgi:hypothetical protein
MNLPTRSLIAAALLFAACKHAEMTGDDHRAAAENAEQKAVTEEQRYVPDAVAHTVAPRAPVDLPASVDVMREYNPTQGHLEEADRQMKIAFKHMQAAEKLEKIEAAECSGLTVAEKTSCPVLAPYVAAVQERREGVTLAMKPNAPTRELTSLLQCHLAFARANNFNRVPCPLFVKGVNITRRDPDRIDVLAPDAKVAEQIRYEARRMFGATDQNVSQR